MEPTDSLPHSQEQATCQVSSLRLCEMVCNIEGFYGEGLSAPCPVPKLEDHTLLQLQKIILQWYRQHYNA
jgi:hypothetical protein